MDKEQLMLTLELDGFLIADEFLRLLAGLPDNIDNLQYWLVYDDKNKWIKDFKLFCGGKLIYSYPNGIVNKYDV